jgi:hypothetical protein
MLIVLGVIAVSLAATLMALVGDLTWWVIAPIVVSAVAVAAVLVADRRTRNP